MSNSPFRSDRSPSLVRLENMVNAARGIALVLLIINAIACSHDDAVLWSARTSDKDVRSGRSSLAPSGPIRPRCFTNRHVPPSERRAARGSLLGARHFPEPVKLNDYIGGPPLPKNGDTYIVSREQVMHVYCPTLATASTGVGGMTTIDGKHFVPQPRAEQVRRGRVANRKPRVHDTIA